MKLPEDSREPAPGSLRLTLLIPSFASKEKKEIVMRPCVPSWNEILGMEQWARQRRKKEIQDAFLCALRASATAFSMRTTFAKSMWSIAADTLEFWSRTNLQKRELRRANAKQKKASQKAP